MTSEVKTEVIAEVIMIYWPEVNAVPLQSYFCHYILKTPWKCQIAKNDQKIFLIFGLEATKVIRPGSNGYQKLAKD